ncbi:DUF2339 domain-containing protein [Sphingobacteriales bacterium CHB3]|nr:DUF2339 domain-containing protein [Sphingobacteriales bacterium CHB3]
MDQPSLSPDENEIRRYLKALDARIARIEAHLNIEQLGEAGEQEEKPVPSALPEQEEEEELEFRIGQSWFAKAGIGVLAIGVAFLLTFPYQALPPFLPSLFGYIIVAVIAAVSYFWRNSFALVSRYLLGGAMLLLYFTTLRLHFFSPEPVLTAKAVLLGLLLAVVAVNLLISVRRKSVYLTGLSLAMGYVTAIVGGEPTFVFVMITLLAVVIVYLKMQHEWNWLAIQGILLSYFTHSVWAMNNPLMGNDVLIASSPQSNLYFILLYAAILATGNLIRNGDTAEDIRALLHAALNGLGAFSLYLFLTLASFKEGFVFSHVLASAVFLGFSVAFWMWMQSRYATFVYAMLGYLALSVAIVGQFKMPDSLIWLSWQTILVISTAVWFRSRFIVVGNFVIYLMVFIAYLILGGTVGLISLSFGIIALLSARILNWQKHRLELKTEMMRNAYLAGAFFVFPYSMYHIVPGGYVSLSWVCIAVFYYAASLILKSHKYRWMALLTLLLTIGHVFIVDTTKLEPSYRIASFLVLGVVLVAVSLAYSRRRTKSKSVGGQDEAHSADAPTPD